MKWLDDDRIRLLIVEVVVFVFAVSSAEADFTFGEPTNLGLPVNSTSGDWMPRISPDGRELYFDSSRPGNHGYWDLYVSVRDNTNAAWGTPQNLGSAVNSSARDGCASLSADGLEMYFHSYNRPGGRGGWDIWVTRRASRQSAWSVPENLGSTVNSYHMEGCVSLSSDGCELYFGSDRPGGYGDVDIWVASRATTNHPWEAPVNLGPFVNSSAEEATPSLSLDNLLLMIGGDVSGPHIPGGYGQADLWAAVRTSIVDPWGKPSNLGSAVNSPSFEYAPTVSPDGTMLYFASDRDGGIGDLDIWQAPIIPIVDFNGDGIVDSLDMCIMIDHWGEDYSLCDIGPMPWGDGVVDIEDLKVLAEHLFEEVDDPTLIAHWPIDETEGMYAVDSVGENNAMVLGGAIWQPSGGQIDGALELDGIDGYAIANPVLNPADDPFSIFTWIKGGAPGQVVVSQQSAANWLTVDTEGNLMTELKGTGRFTGPLISEIVIADGQWHRVGLVWNGTNRILYVDGEAVAEDTLAGLEGSQMGLYIGVDKNYNPGTFFAGLIDDIRIYNAALSAEQIKGLAQ